MTEKKEKSQKGVDQNETEKDQKILLRFRTERARKAFKENNDSEIDHSAVMRHGLAFAGITMWKWYPNTGSLEIEASAESDPTFGQFLSATKWEKIVHQNDRKRLKESIRRFQDSGYSVFDCAFRLATAIPRWVHARDMYHVSNSDGTLSTVVGLFFDVTESELSKEKMFWGRELPRLVEGGPAAWGRMLAEFDRHKMDSEKIGHLMEQCGYEFDSLMQRGDIPCFKKDANFKYTRINEAFEKLVDLTADEILQRTDEEIQGKDIDVRSRRIYKNVIKQREGTVTFHKMSFNGVPSLFILECYPDWGSNHQIDGINGVLLPLSSSKRRKSASASKRQRKSIEMRATNLKAQLAAQCDAILLLTGESGSGKDYLARNIHDLSSRAHKPFLNLNCGGFSSGVIESELFGHEKGAFTGAIRQKKGLAELAEDGTLFLNEIGELPLDLQTKLLKFLDDRTFYRVGGQVPIQSKARIIAATNRNLGQEVDEGRFRQDLYYRLCVCPIHVPPLRERLEDLPDLVKHLLRKIETNVDSENQPEIDALAMKKLCEYTWPGNIRELRNVLERAIILAHRSVVTPEHINFETSQPTQSRRDIRKKQTSDNIPFIETLKPGARSRKPVHDEIKRLFQEFVLEKSWSRAQLARHIGVDSSTLKKWFKQAGIPEGSGGRPKKNRVE